MKILAISTSSNNASVSLLENDNIIKELNIIDQKTHSEKLMPLIQELFEIFKSFVPSPTKIRLLYSLKVPTKLLISSAR